MENQWRIMIKLLFAFVLWLVGSMANLFIVVSIIIQIQLERSLQPANILLAFNCLNNLAIGIFVIIVYHLMMTACPNNGRMPVLLFLWELSSGMQIWNIVLICVFYCLKIIPGWGTTFLLLKRNFSSVAVTILLVGFTFTLATCFIDTYRETPLNGTLRFHNGTCSHIELPDRLIPARLSIIYLMYTIVLTLVISSCWAVVAHLRSHMKRMRGNQSEVGGAKQEGIARVALMIFLLAVEFVVCTIVRHTLLVLSGDKISRYLIQDNSLIALMLSSLIPITLITGINTLRQRATTCFSSTSQNV